MINIKPFLTKEQLDSKVKLLGQQISNYYSGKEIVLVCILKGSFIFTSDLARQITVPLRMEFMAVRSYNKTKSTGTVQITQDLTSPIDGEHVILVEDIVDTGITSRFLIDFLKTHNPASLSLCSLLYKPSKVKCSVNIDFLGFEIPDIFVVGYGLDYEQKYRNLPYIGTYAED